MPPAGRVVTSGPKPRWSKNVRPGKPLPERSPRHAWWRSWDPRASSYARRVAEAGSMRQLGCLLSLLRPPRVVLGLACGGLAGPCVVGARGFAWSWSGWWLAWWFGGGWFGGWWCWFRLGVDIRARAWYVLVVRGHPLGLPGKYIGPGLGQPPCGRLECASREWFGRGAGSGRYEGDCSAWFLEGDT
jgi:hypothetical protein